MAKNKTRGGMFRQIPLMVALLAAFVFSAGNGLQSLVNENVREHQTQQQKQDKSEDERPVAYLDYAFDAIAPAAQLLFFHTGFKIALPVLHSAQDIQKFIPPVRGSDPFFKVLFRLIISPNAP